MVICINAIKPREQLLLYFHYWPGGGGGNHHLAFELKTTFNSTVLLFFQLLLPGNQLIFRNIHTCNVLVEKTVNIS